MFLGQEFLQLGQFVVLLRLPVARDFEDGEEAFGVLPEVLGEVLDKDIGT
jgi:hypothetical protein